MKTGDLVEYFCHSKFRNKIGIFLRYGINLEKVHGPGRRERRLRDAVLIGSDGKLIETYNYLEINQRDL